MVHYYLSNCVFLSISSKYEPSKRTQKTTTEFLKVDNQYKKIEQMHVTLDTQVKTALLKSLDHYLLKICIFIHRRSSELHLDYFSNNKTGLLILRDDAILQNQPKIASSCTIH